MFTGLIQQVGHIVALKRTKGAIRITVEYGPWETGLGSGESIAVNGACLTVSDLSENSFSADLLEETAGRTTLLSLKNGDRVNLERALRPSDRLGGHFVTGHIDEAGIVSELGTEGRDYVIKISCSLEMMSLVVEKGSIACNGVSLTVAAVDESAFKVKIIPFTWNNTTLCSLKQGDLVNLEADILGKYVYRFLKGGMREQILSMDDLRNAGFLD